MPQQPGLNGLHKILYLLVKTDAEPDTSVFAAVLTALNQSFYNFVFTELYLQNSIVKTSLKKEINLFVAECRLVIKDISLSDQIFTISVCINALNQQYNLLKNAAELKDKVFDTFTNTVFSTEIFSSAFAQKISEKYSAKQRIGIFKPFADLTEKKKFQLYFGQSADAITNLWQPVEDLTVMSIFISEAIKLPNEPVESYYQYIKIGEERDLFGKRSKYEKVLIKENLKHDLYPYQLQKINIKGKKYTFIKQVSATVSIKNNFYEISFPDLLLNVKHETRVGAEKAFDAALAVLIVKLEKDRSSQSIALVKLKGFLNEY